MNARTFRLILLIACCHGLVHVFEHALSSAEQSIALTFGVGQEVTGLLSTTLRLPFGVFAIFAGWLADRYGPKRLLVVYLLGVGGAALLTFLSTSLALLFVAMFTMGLFASIYHPAGVGLISHHTTRDNRPLALGYHGIFGSLGIAGGPFLAALAFGMGASWNQYYLMLAVPAVLLAVLVGWRLPADRFHETPGTGPARTPAEHVSRWDCYALLMIVSTLAGFVYAAVMTFLPRYLTEAGVDLSGALARVTDLFGQRSLELQPISQGNLFAGLVLMLGMFGQYGSGRLARHGTLEWILAGTFFMVAPCLAWMAWAQGTARIWAAALFALIFFTHQPVFNSLVAKYVARRRRSLAYGLTFTLGFGLGSLGPAVAGRMPNDRSNYLLLAGIALATGATALVLRWRANTS